MNAMAVEKKAKIEFDPNKAEILELNQLGTPRALNSEGGINALAVSGAWTDVVYNPNVTQAGSWVLGPLMTAPAGTPSSSIVQNITWQWNIWNYRSDLITYLCESTLNQCVNVSGNFGAGANVSSANIPANRAWRYIFGVPGSGTINPALLGQNGSIAVNYQ